MRVSMERFYRRVTLLIIRSREDFFYYEVGFSMEGIYQSFRLSIKCIHTNFFLYKD